MKNTIFFLAVLALLLNTVHGMNLVAVVDTLLYGGAPLGETKEIEIFVGVLDTTPHYMISSKNLLFRGNLLHQDQIFAISERTVSKEITDVAVIPDNTAPMLVAVMAEADTGVLYFFGDTGTDWRYSGYIPVEGLPVKIKKTPEKYLVTLTAQGIFVHDCSKYNPTLVSSYITPTNGPKDIIVEGDKAYVLGYNVLLVF